MAMLSGNMKRRYMVEPSVPKDAPECPEWLDEIAKQEWASITGILSDMGLLSRADKTALECYCESYSRYRKAQATVARVGAVILSPTQKYPMVSPYHTIMRQALKDLSMLLIQFGLTPSARSKLGQDVRNQPADGLNWDGLIG
jgi:P27 family predicted phage terminase small subunit